MHRKFKPSLIRPPNKRDREAGMDLKIDNIFSLADSLTKTLPESVSGEFSPKTNSTIDVVEDCTNNAKVATEISNQVFTGGGDDTSTADEVREREQFKDHDDDGNVLTGDGDDTNTAAEVIQYEHMKENHGNGKVLTVDGGDTEKAGDVIACENLKENLGDGQVFTGGGTEIDRSTADDANHHAHLPAQPGKGQRSREAQSFLPVRSVCSQERRDDGKDNDDVPPSLSCEKSSSNSRAPRFGESLGPPVLSPADKECVTPKWPQSIASEYSNERMPTQVDPCYIVLSCISPYIHCNTYTSYRTFQRSYRECTNMCKKQQFKRRLKAGKDVFNVKAPTRRQNYQYYIGKEENKTVMIQLSKNRSKFQPVSELKDLLKRNARFRGAKRNGHKCVGRIQRHVHHVPKDFVQLFRREKETDLQKYLEDEEIVEHKLCLQEVEKMLKADVETLKTQVEQMRNLRKSLKKNKCSDREQTHHSIRDSAVSFSGRQRKANTRYGKEYAVTERELNDCQMIAMVEESIRREERRKHVASQQKICKHCNKKHGIGQTCSPARREHLQTTSDKHVRLWEKAKAYANDKRSTEIESESANCNEMKDEQVQETSQVSDIRLKFSRLGSRKGLKRRSHPNVGHQSKRRKGGKLAITKEHSEIIAEVLHDAQDYTGLSNVCSGLQATDNPYADVKALLNVKLNRKENHGLNSAKVKNPNKETSESVQSDNELLSSIPETVRLLCAEDDTVKPGSKAKEFIINQKQRKRDCQTVRSKSKLGTGTVSVSVKGSTFSVLPGGNRLVRSSPVLQSSKGHPLTCTAAPNIAATNTPLNQSQILQAISQFNRSKTNDSYANKITVANKGENINKSTIQKTMVMEKVQDKVVQTQVIVSDKNSGKVNGLNVPSSAYKTTPGAALVSATSYIMSACNLVVPVSLKLSIADMNRSSGTSVQHLPPSCISVSSKTTNSAPTSVPQVPSVQHVKSGLGTASGAPLPVVSRTTQSNVPKSRNETRYVLVKLSGQSVLLPVANAKISTAKSASKSAVAQSRMPTESTANSAELSNVLLSGFQSVTSNSSLQSQAQRHQATSVAQSNIQARSISGPKVISAVDAAKILHRHSTMRTEQMQEVPTKSVISASKLITSRPLINSSSVYQSTQLKIVNSAKSPELSSVPAANALCNKLPYQPTIQTVAGGISTSAALPLLTTIKQEPLDEFEYVDTHTTAQQCDRSEASKPKISSTSTKIINTHDAQGAVENDVSLPISTTQMSSIPETNEKVEMLAKSPEDNPVQPRAFSESLTDRGEKLRKLKALLKEKQKAVESIRISTKKS